MVIVTGASRGVGNAVSKALSEAGAIVIGTSRSAESVAQMNEEMEKEGCSGMGYILDVSDERQINVLFKDIDRRYGRIDALINNAGIAAGQPFLNSSVQEWNDILNTNLYSLFTITQEAAKRMHAQRSGRILFIASEASVRGISHMPAYCASKHGVLGFARALQEEFKGTGILVSTLMPGPINTTILGGDPSLMNYIRPEDIAAMIVHLLSLQKSIEVREILMVPTGL